MKPRKRKLIVYLSLYRWKWRRRESLLNAAMEEKELQGKFYWSEWAGTREIERLDGELDGLSYKLWRIGAA